MQWLYRWLDRIFAVIGAFFLSQFPQFYEQYVDRAKGHLEELRHQIALMAQSAELTGKTLDVYIKKFVTSEDPDIYHQGNLMQKMVDRAQELADGIVSMTQADLFTRPMAFLGHVQSDIANATVAEFKPGFTLNLEGFIYALLGIFFGYGILHLILRLIAGFWMLLTRPFRRTKTGTY